MPSTSVSLLHVRFDRLRPWMDSRVPRARYEFHIRKEARSRYDVPETLFASSGNVIFADFYAARVFAAALNRQVNPVTHPERVVKAGKVNAMALIDELLHAVCDLYRETVKPDAFAIVWAAVEEAIGKRQAHALLLSFVKTYPPAAVHTGRQSAEDWLVDSDGGVPNALVALEELYLVRLANENPAFEPFGFLFDDADLRSTTKQKEAIAALERAFEAMPALGPDGETLTAMLRAPMRASPYSLAGQLDFMRRRWGMVLAEIGRAHV